MNMRICLRFLCLALLVPLLGDGVTEVLAQQWLTHDTGRLTSRHSVSRQR